MTVRPPAALFALCLATHAVAQAPIETRIHRSISLPFLRLDPRGDLVAPGRGEFQFGWTSTNDLRYMPSSGFATVREDYEVDRFMARYRRRVGPGEWTFEVPFLIRGGGFMDPLIEAWHEHVLGIHNLRSNVAFGRSEVIVPGSGRFGSAAGIGDIAAAYSLPFGRNLFGTAAVKLPTGDASRLLGSGAADGAVGLFYRSAIGPHWSVHLQAGAVAQGKPTKLRGARGLVDQESIAFVYRANSRDSWIGQWQSEASPLVTGVAGSDSTHRQLTVGYARKLSDRRSLQLFFSEDGDFLNYRVPELVNIAPDFTIGLRYTVRL